MSIKKIIPISEAGKGATAVMNIPAELFSPIVSEGYHVSSPAEEIREVVEKIVWGSPRPVEV